LSSRLKDTSIQRADAKIKALQEREERERQARTKAQVALAEEASELTLCVAQQEVLETDMEKCGDELLTVTQRRKQYVPVKASAPRTGLPHQPAGQRSAR